MVLSKSQRERLHAKYGGHCAYCGIELPKTWHADHLEPIGRIMRWDSASRKFVDTGEMNDPKNDHYDNLMPACSPCNINKHSLSLEQWRNYLSMVPTNQLKYSSSLRAANRFGLIVVVEKPVTFYFETFIKRRPIPEGGK